MEIEEFKENYDKIDKIERNNDKNDDKIEKNDDKIEKIQKNDNKIEKNDDKIEKNDGKIEKNDDKINEKKKGFLSYFSHKKADFLRNREEKLSRRAYKAL